ncbi:MAG: four helix bundle protein [Draconibacterium sp.]|nr:MAG: four helix bundle protein [Draconibacterium sp.]
MTAIKRFEELEIWQLARELAREVHLLTSKEKFSKDFSLKNQIKSSSGSTMDNIAEGFERDGSQEFHQFLSIAKGSCGETRSQFYRSFDSGHISEDELNAYTDKCLILSRKIGNMMAYIRNSNIKGNKYKK